MRWLLVALAAAGCPKGTPDLEASPDRIPDHGVVSAVMREGNLLSRLSHAPADLVVFHVAEQRGSLATCGCPRRPRGSLARFAGQVSAARAAAPSPDVAVHAGSWLADAVDYMGQPRLDAAEMDRWMVRGMALAGFDAINVSTQDVPGLVAVGADPSLPLVSANLAGPGIARWRVVERGALRVGMTGVTGGVVSLSDPGGYRLAPAADAEPALRELVAQADVVVLLSWSATEQVRELVRRVPGVDVVIDAAIRDEAPEAGFLGPTLLAFSVYQGVQLGELRLTLAEGRVRSALDRHVDLDDVAPEDPALAALAAEARTALDRVRRELYGP